LSLNELKSKRRTQNLVVPRQIAMFLTRRLVNLSFPAIGEQFGGRDHTTVLHACRQVAKLRESMPDMNHDVNFLLQVLRS
jgi:chromosomal replication initiator protein